jgi:hypothetical protein
MTSCDAKQPFCQNGSGSIAYGGNGRFTLIISSRDRPKIAGVTPATDRTTISADNYKAIGQGNVSQFGTYTVNEADKTITNHIESSFFPSDAGTDRKLSIVLTGDELTQQVAAVPAAAQEKTLKQQVQGAWNWYPAMPKYQSAANPTGSISYNGNGRYTIVAAAKNRPIPASVASTPGPRDKITPEEYKAIAQAFAAQFGTWSVNETDKTITTHIEDGLIPTAADGTATVVSVTADELKTNGALGNAVWRRFK